MTGLEILADEIRKYSSDRGDYIHESVVLAHRLLSEQVSSLTTALKESVERSDEEIEALMLARAAIDSHNKLVAERDAALTRAEAAERQNADLRAALAENQRLTKEILGEKDSEAAALRAEAGRLREKLGSTETRLLEAIHDDDRYRDRLAAAEALLGKLSVWADTYGSALKPSAGAADSYGDGVRTCKAQVRSMLNAFLSSAPTPSAAEAKPECDCASLRAEVERLKAEITEAHLAWSDQPEPNNALPHRVWEAMGELTSYLIDGKHMLDVDAVRGVFERLLSSPAAASAAPCTTCKGEGKVLGDCLDSPNMWFDPCPDCKS